MSTFLGKVDEIPGISVDRFEENNLDSSVFFLSHCHADHYKGLWFNQGMIIRKENCYLYTSEASEAILKDRFPNLGRENKVKMLDLYEPNLIYIPSQNKYVTVRIIPAGHCPGSVMFLFDYEGKNILYTGDFRLDPEDFKKIKHFYDVSGNLIKIDKVYLDTTFFTKSYRWFPPRDKCIEEICAKIEDWISLGKDHEIKIISGASICIEILVKEISKRMNMPIHTCVYVFESYQYFPEMDKSVTLSSENTQIHLKCDCSYRKFRTIKVTAFSWDSDKMETFKQEPNGRFFDFCYSTHSSYEETLAFLDFLKPKDIYPCVLYDRNIDEVTKTIKELVTKYNKNDDLSRPPPERLFLEDDSVSPTKLKCITPKDKDLSDDEVELLSSPTLSRKKVKKNLFDSS